LARVSHPQNTGVFTTQGIGFAGTSAGLQPAFDEFVKSAKARHSGEGRSPEVSEITGSGLRRDDKIGENSTFYMRITFEGLTNGEFRNVGHRHLLRA
jgi:hypothetical protein